MASFLCDILANIGVSIPKRVSEVLWRDRPSNLWIVITSFQSLKGFQRFCGLIDDCGEALGIVSIPKRVSEVLWRRAAGDLSSDRLVSIPKRVSEVLWLHISARHLVEGISFNP